jgi:hypothetical protein
MLTLVVWTSTTTGVWLVFKVQSLLLLLLVLARTDELQQWDRRRKLQHQQQHGRSKQSVPVVVAFEECHHDS